MSTSMPSAEQGAQARHGIPELDNNPLIACIPSIPHSDEERYFRLAQRIEYNDRERYLPNAYRKLCLKRLNRFFVPADPVHHRAYEDLTVNMFDSYLQRNPFTRNGQALLYGENFKKQRESQPSTYRPPIALITGHSGAGKSTLVDRILEAWGPQAIQHTAFNGRPFPEMQLLWMRRNVPSNCTVGRLCRTFGRYADQALGTDIYSADFARLKRGDAGEDIYLDEISKIVRTHHVGLLVLDEFNNLSLIGTGAKKILALIVNLRDELGIPILLVGTKKSLKLLEGDFAPARRLAEGGYFEIARPDSADDPIFRATCEAMWQYQWLKGASDELTDAMVATLYFYSQGITGVLVALFREAQSLAIEEGVEELTPRLVERAFQERMQPLHKAIRALQTKDPKLADKFDDLSANFWPNEQVRDDPAGTEHDAELQRKAEEFAGSGKAQRGRSASTIAPKRSATKAEKISAEQLRSEVEAEDGLTALSRLLDR